MLEQVKTNHSTATNLWRKVALSFLAKLQQGRLQVNEDGEQWQFGSGDPVASLTIVDPLAWKKLIVGGSIGMAEAYRDGLWHTDDLVGLIALFSRNLDIIDRLESRFSWPLKPFRRIQHLLRSNSKRNARRNIEAHYDLSNEFYQLFLDPSMLYSSAIYGNAASLEQAQWQKMERLCHKLKLQPSDHLLEIGTGWGAMAIHAAKHYGCRVTTTTISDAQYQEAKRRIELAGLTEQITLVKQDYRDLRGQYDKMVSIEMIEAVGEQYMASYFNQLQQLLKPGGLLALQSITIADQRYDHYRRNVDFIQAYIFPGGFLPSVSLLAQQFSQRTDMVIRDIADIGLDYGKTLADWRERFEQHLGQVYQLGFDESFVRLWRFYFCYCQAGFETRRTSAVQLLVEKPKP